jgi:hypothetical protein
MKERKREESVGKIKFRKRVEKDKERERGGWGDRRD